MADGPLTTVISLADMAAKMGKTEDDLKAWIRDTPNRHRAAIERIATSPQFIEAMRRQAGLTKSQKGGNNE